MRRRAVDLGVFADTVGTLNTSALRDGSGNRCREGEGGDAVTLTVIYAGQLHWIAEHDLGGERTLEIVELECL